MLLFRNSSMKIPIYHILPYIPYLAPKTESIHIYKKTYRDFTKVGQNMVYQGKKWYKVLFALCDIQFNEKTCSTSSFHNSA